jgi:DNA adenine methylase
VKSPISWVGGKKNPRKHIISLIPADHTCYVEAFAGGAWVLFGKKRSEIEMLNDLDGDLVNFYTVVKRHFGRICVNFIGTLKRLSNRL